ncbi:uncharacterized protein PHACADRAFT_250873 [Phanerochaete carnosa HHB-10118-sp]|uniref:DUF6533 domain-containing protein n=1 Tax=Phanerochaete carnosa (strain HHB-10118-sp) TaxID=650164 RepID=K5VAX1_PHACS|nr:uncharacterized protein PHACADRAFT_250873 [Phanerochaete carnosa HHB-10118-sp]EKM60021.1 hypothetical protein PHACADRAFT_250873 [Phanerochaete carnosa HHB-10118-sp]
MMADHRLQLRAAAGWQLDLQTLMQSEDASRSLVAALAFLVWDILITLDDEAVHIWMTEFQPLKILYIFTRYYSALALIIVNTQTLSCKGWVIIEGTSAVLLEIAVETILILRIYAMYTANRRLLYALIFGLVVQVTIMVAALGASLPQLKDSPQCAELVFPTGIIAYSIACITFESLLLGLTLNKYFTAISEGWGGVMLLNILVRDGVWAFALLFIANVANTLFFTIAPATLAALGFPWLLVILGALGPRLILNIRREHSRTLSSSSFDDADMQLPMAAYVAANTDDTGDWSSDSHAHASRSSFASWQSVLLWRRVDVP